MSIADIKDKFFKASSAKEDGWRLNKLNYKFMNTMGASTAMVSGLAAGESQLQAQIRSNLSQLSSQRAQLENQLSQLPAGDLSLRNDGVALAWDYEQSLVELGAGSRDWTSNQMQELLEYGSVSGIEGHHINSVAEHPKLQAEADNIDFLTRQEHFQAHEGDWRNPTSGELYDRRVLIRREMIKSELFSLGSAILIGGGIGVVLSLFEENLSWQDRASWFKEGAILGGIGYSGGRIMGGVISLLAGGNLSSFTHFFGIGLGSSIAMASYFFHQTQKQGGNKIQAFQAATLHFGVSLSGLLMMGTAQSIWGGPAGFIAGGIFFGGFLAVNYLEKKKIKDAVKKAMRYKIEILAPL